MISIREQVCSALPARRAFDFVADFSNLPAWDPGIASVERLDYGELGVGARFRVMARFGGREVPMTYEVVRWQPPHRATLEGRTDTLHAVDDIRVEPSEGGTRIDYAADFRLLGIARLGAPLMGPWLRRIGRRAIDGLQQALSNESPAAEAAPSEVASVRKAS